MSNIDGGEQLMMRGSRWTLTTGITVLVAVWMVQGQTMDEMIIMSQESSSDAVQFPDNDTVRLELDMLFTPEDYEVMYYLDHNVEMNRKKRKAIDFEERRWPDNEIPYSIGEGFSAQDRREIQAGVDDWNRYTCINFRPVQSGDRNYIKMKNSGGCSSFVGMIGGLQRLTLGRGCRKKGVIMHEMGHALGFYHEQARSDRDQYVKIDFDNVNDGMEYNFDKHSASVLDDHGVPYDYLSIMHYGEAAFSKNGEITIQTLDPAYQEVIGTKQTLSFKDVKLANIIYKCGEKCGQKTCRGDGFVGKDCKCYCPGSPMKVCGTSGKSNKSGKTSGRKNKDGKSRKGGRKGKGSGGSSSCKDVYPNCALWASRGECSRNPGWMNKNCKKACKKCSKKGGKSDCRDSKADCAYWASMGECTRSASWMSSNCKKSCKKCDGTQASNKVCVDQDGSCKHWAEIGHCTHRAYQGYMKDACPLSCNMCTGQVKEPVPTCEDNNRSCPYWASTGGCYTNGAYMSTHCKKSCRFC